MLIKKIFVCEFITAGGFNRQELPAGMIAEGKLMRDALLHDLSTLPYEISTTTDVRIESPVIGKNITVHSHDDVWKIWSEQIDAVDAVWLIAPETDGVLQRLTATAIKKGKLVIGCGANAINVTSEKLATYHMLQQAGIPTIPTYMAENWPQLPGQWLVKPNNGAGCEDTILFNKADDLADWLKLYPRKKESHVIQPYQQGIPASISCVMHNGTAQLLSCNKQMISIENNQLSFAGSQINGMRDFWQPFESIARQIAAIDSGLNGYVGIDVIVNVQERNQITVVEINPRLTTSYAGLAEAIGNNPAELIINTLTQPDFMWPELKRHVVDIHV